MTRKSQILAAAVLAGLALPLVSGCSSASQSIQQSAGESVVGLTADAIVRNANAIALGSPVTQEDLDQAADEVTGSMPEYTSTDLGSGDSPAMTLTLSKEGLSCSVRIGKAEGGEKVAVVSTPTCS